MNAEICTFICAFPNVLNELPPWGDRDFTELTTLAPSVRGEAARGLGHAS